MPKTYWHLSDKRAIPTEYEIVSSRLDYRATRGFEIDHPVASWYETHQSALVSDDWEQFADPASTTYTTYVSRRRDQEVYLDNLIAGVDRRDGDPGAGWRRAIGNVSGVLRSP